ncbi:tyrosine-type recombinase/integrase [Magnetofaba australis]|uniref:Putative integrase family protein n=1 Tax=Magnetofaba australis IT-1 TaxID=1434232 RepID=A0A1Y2K8L5_9PROT|nr:integrase arm-type DNA-binding domain-containing protein [Magnetofaba australis]OSM07081.1 putative integrase family protein [Magnetofaba australis IT-1]
MPLTDTEIRRVKAEGKTLKLTDGGGMYLEVSPTGRKWWRLKYRFGGKEKRLALGVYPDVTLKAARQKRGDARRLLADGVDPGQHRKAQKAAAIADEQGAFETVAMEWYAKHAPNWTDSNAKRLLSLFKRDIFPWIGARPIGEITPPELLKVLRRIESRGAVETAHRARANCGQVFRYAVAIGLAERDPTGDLKGALPPVKSKRMATIIDPKMIGELLRDIDRYEGSFITRCALKLAPLTFARPGELRHAEWSEIGIEAKEWRIPAGKMKAREMHIVPLSRQALEILAEIKPLTGNGRYVFPGVRSAARPMSENTVLAALRRLGYEKGQMTGHGFRAMASTRLNEMGWPADVIERQLAHAERNEVRAAYNHAQHLAERVKMMQAWADYLDALRDGADILPFKRQA